MKRLILILITTLLSLSAIAQPQMSVESFAMEQNDVTARVHSPRMDQNERKAALIKIETSEKNFAFDVGTMGVVDTDFSQVAEVWVYVPSGVIHMTIKHQQFGIIDYEFPIPIQEATVYRMKLTTNKLRTIVEERPTGHYLRLRVNPSDADASITIGNNPPQAIYDGEFGALLPYGEHNYRITSKYYKDEVGVLNVANGDIRKEITLIPNYGYISINSTPSATITINGFEVGNTPYKSNKMALGDYTISLTAPNYAAYKETHTLDIGGKTLNVSQTLRSFLSQVTIKTDKPEAQISINNEAKSKGQWKGTLMPGTYAIEASLTGHRSTIQTITIEPSTTREIKLTSPEPMYGSINIETQQLDVEVRIDDKYIGTAPSIFSNILAGRHTVTLSRSGFESVNHTVTIEEGKIALLKQERLMSATTTTTAASTTTRSSTTALQRVNDMPKKIFSSSDYAALGSPKMLKIPLGYTHIGDDALRSAALITLTIPKSVVSIGDRAFYGCSKLAIVSITPDSVVEIGSNAFTGCVSLKSVNLPGSVESIGVNAFPSTCNVSKAYTTNPRPTTKPYTTKPVASSSSAYQSGVFTKADYIAMGSPVNLVIPREYTSIAEKALERNDNIRSVIIPTSVTEVGERAFCSCKNLTSVKIPNSVTKVGFMAFWKYSKHAKLTIYVSKQSPVYKALKDKARDHNYTLK